MTGRADSLSFKVRASTIQGRALLTYTAPNYFAIAQFQPATLRPITIKRAMCKPSIRRRAEGSVRLAQKLSLQQFAALSSMPTGT